MARCLIPNWRGRGGQARADAERRHASEAGTGSTGKGAGGDPAAEPGLLSAIAGNSEIKPSSGAGCRADRSPRRSPGKPLASATAAAFVEHVGLGGAPRRRVACTSGTRAVARVP